MPKTKRSKARSTKRPARRKATKQKPAARKSTKRRTTKTKPKPSKAAKRKSQSNFKVFIAWSGDQSKAVGSKLQKRLKTILPKIEILFSPAFNPGDAWARRLQSSIRRADYAILCVTKESLDSRWMNFEAGAAWKGLRQANVCPLLLDVSPNDLSGPLSLFEAKRFVYSEFEELCKYLGRRARMSSDVVKGNLDNVWIGLEQDVKEHLAKSSESKKS